MISVAVAVPLGIALVGAVGSLAIGRRLRPAVSAWFFLAALVLSAWSVLWATALVAVGGTPAFHSFANLLNWCAPGLREHGDLPVPLGAAALGSLLASVVSVGRTRSAQRLSCAPRGVGALVVVENDEPNAFALPGTPGQIVVTTALIDLLDPDELRVVMAHEQAHLDLGHHRFVRVAELSGAAVPLLRPLVRRVRLATERWADEVAALQVRDRRLVATAVAHAALGRVSARAGLLGVSDTGVVERVEALLAAPQRPHRGVEILAGLSLFVSFVVVLGSTVPAHHWIARFATACIS